ncbi:MAG TPA: HD domain-containing phosphohydrolase [Solirubrobacteraceae bacterium]|nr:HD domain-containing phosphohydrolase [Solirubrobacteraceae bacterium]
MPATSTKLRPDHPRVRNAIRVLAAEMRLHHRPTADHSHRLARLARRVAENMGLDPLCCTEVELVAVLHDVGKLAIDRRILDHAGPLDDLQRHIMRRHTIQGEDILVMTAGLEHLGPIVRATHEWWDGCGYPDGLAGLEIPLEARIVSCADAYDAMVNERSYRPAFTPREAARRIDRDAGRQFDPVVAAALLDLVRP